MLFLDIIHNLPQCYLLVSWNRVQLHAESNRVDSSLGMAGLACMVGCRLRFAMVLHALALFVVSTVAEEHPGA